MLNTAFTVAIMIQFHMYILHDPYWWEGSEMFVVLSSLMINYERAETDTQTTMLQSVAG